MLHRSLDCSLRVCPLESIGKRTFIDLKVVRGMSLVASLQSFSVVRQIAMEFASRLRSSGGAQRKQLKRSVSNRNMTSTSSGQYSKFSARPARWSDDPRLPREDTLLSAHWSDDPWTPCPVSCSDQISARHSTISMSSFRHSQQTRRAAL